MNLSIDINDLYLIVSQLTIDLKAYQRSHEQLAAMMYGGGKEGLEEAKADHLGKYQDELERIIEVLKQDIHLQHIEKEKQTFHQEKE